MRLAKGFWKSLTRVVPCPERRAALKKLWDTQVMIPSVFPKTAGWALSCYHEPFFQEIFLSACDEAAENFGIEGFDRAGEWIEYSNTGDSYAETVVFWCGTFLVTSWGDIVEGEDA